MGWYEMLSFWVRMSAALASAFWLAAGLSFFYQTPHLSCFLSLAVLLTLAPFFFPVVAREQGNITEAILEVYLGWHLLALFAAVPFYCSGVASSFWQSYFAAISGLTTTGSSFVNLYDAGLDLQFYQHWLQFLGGLGTVVFVLAIAPQRFHNARFIFNVEITGLGRKRLHPRVQTSARYLLMFYLLLVLICAMAFFHCGLDITSSLLEALSVVSTGGATLHADGLMHYQSDTLLYVAMLFMVIGSMNFQCHVFALLSANLKGYWRHEENRYYLLWLLFWLAVVVFGSQLMALDGLKNSFALISMMTTTGSYSGVVDDGLWGLTLTYLALIGGCAGSTAGGIKIVRWQRLYHQFFRVLFFFIKPHQVLPVDQSMNMNWAVQGFAVVLLFSVLAFQWLFVLGGASIMQAWQLALAHLSCVGAMVIVPIDMQALSLFNQWVSAEAMIAGRMEWVTFWVIFYRRFWYVANV